MSNEDAIIPEGTIYFTTRKTKEGWFAEKLYSQDGNWVRERIDVPGGRMHAMEQFKITVGRYWQKQLKELL